MMAFELAEPPSLKAAIGLLNPHYPTIRPMAGGTALMLMMKAGVFHPIKLISLRKIESRYSRVEFDGNELHIGAMTTLGTLERSSEIQKHAPSSRVPCARCRMCVCAPLTRRFSKRSSWQRGNAGP